eukprot:2331725-Rhodomonas_salina.2
MIPGPSDPSPSPGLQVPKSRFGSYFSRTQAFDFLQLSLRLGSNESPTTVGYKGPLYPDGKALSARCSAVTYEIKKPFCLSTLLVYPCRGPGPS